MVLSDAPFRRVAMLLLATCLGCAEGSDDLTAPTDPEASVSVYRTPAARAITNAEARGIAASAVSGEIISTERDHEPSGRTVIDVTIRVGLRVFAVEVDANTGEITELEEKAIDVRTGEIIDPDTAADSDDDDDDSLDGEAPELADSDWGDPLEMNSLE